MIEIEAQVSQDSKSYHVLPMYYDEARNYKPNQIVRLKVYGVEKQRSVLQMNTYWACCKEVANNTDNPKWNHKEKVDFQIRVALDFRDQRFIAVSGDGSIQFKYLSIAFANLKHIMACNFFERAFEVMAEFLQVSVEELIEMAKANMGR